MPLAGNALTTIENALAYAQGVGEAIPPEHALNVEFTINAVSEAVERFLHRKLAKATYTDELHTGYALRIPGSRPDGTDERYLYPHQWPILSMASVKIDGTAITEHTDFGVEIDSEKWVKHKAKDGEWIALFRGDAWKSDPLGIVLTYDAGYVLPGKTGTRSLPYDLEEYAIRLVLAEYLHRGKQGLITESFAGMSLTLDRWPLDVLQGLRRHQRVRV